MRQLTQYQSNPILFCTQLCICLLEHKESEIAVLRKNIYCTAFICVDINTFFYQIIPDLVEIPNI